MTSREMLFLQCFMYFWIGIFSLELFYLISFLAGKRKRAFPFYFFIHIFAAAGFLSFLYAYFIEPYRLETRHVHIVSEKLKGENFTLVQISDLHCDEKPRNEENLVKTINALEPDLIVFTGDSINSEKALPLFKKTLSRLEAKAGKFAVKGNFDTWYWENLDLFGNTGFEELNEKTVFISKGKERMAVSGVNYYDSDLTFLKNLPEGVYSVLLSHYPGMNERKRGLPVDLFLAGHTHGGQVALPFYGALITPSRYGKKYEAGRYEKEGKIIYVNRGIGMEGGKAPRIRFLARPEITVFHIRSRGEPRR